jgi:hypothetical protein
LAVTPAIHGSPLPLPIPAGHSPCISSAAIAAVGGTVRRVVRAEKARSLSGYAGSMEKSGFWKSWKVAGTALLGFGGTRAWPRVPGRFWRAALPFTARGLASHRLLGLAVGFSRAGPPDLWPFSHCTKQGSPSPRMDRDWRGSDGLKKRDR